MLAILLSTEETSVPTFVSHFLHSTLRATYKMTRINNTYKSLKINYALDNMKFIYYN